MVHEIAVTLGHSAAPEVDADEQRDRSGTDSGAGQAGQQ
jgi:hypothetical protein